jgi:alpha-L-rhamnosidase
MRFGPTIAALLATSPLLCLAAPEMPAMPKQVERDPRVRDYVTPTRVVWQSPPVACAVLDAEQLLEPFKGQITISHEGACTLRNNGQPPAILLDFGRELHGGIQIAVGNLRPAATNLSTVRVRVRFGESAAEAMSDLGGETDATNDHAVRDETLLLPRWGTTQLGDTGFRFVRLDLLDTNTAAEVRAVRAVFVHRDLQPTGAFRCSDERLNQIWATGAYTVFLNMQTYLWDGIKRDRLVWIGDMHPETSTIEAVFGSDPIVPASLDLVRDITPLPHWMNGISSYSLWWIIIQRDWFRQCGDTDYLRQQQSYLNGLLAQLEKCIDAEGSERLPERRFLDWPSSENPKAIHAGLQSLMILAFRAGEDIATALSDATTALECRQAVGQLRKHIPDPANSKQAAALMVLSGLGDPVRLNKEILAADGAQRLSTFYGYYVLQARAKVGDYQGCLDTIRQYWGGMLDLGATTFWEDFNLDWVPGAGRIDELPGPVKKDLHGSYGAYCYVGYRHSLCHGWASGPTAWLSRYVLGVEIVEPGCKTIRVTPHLGDLGWVEGVFPTPHGPMKIRHEKQADGTIKSDIKAPDGVKVLP